MAATDQQVQTFVNERFRPFAELARNLYLLSTDHIAVIGDVYDNVNAGSPTWTDNRTDGPPHLLTPADVLAWNTFMVNFNTFVAANAQWPTILKACVRAPGV